MSDCLEPLYKIGVDERESKEIINLGSSTFYTINEINEILIVMLYKGVKSVHLEPRHEKVKNLQQKEKSMELLDYKDTTDLELGLSNILIMGLKNNRTKKTILEIYEAEKGHI